MREIVFDTETTGLSFSGGDRLIEIGCVEMVNRVETGRTFHAYYNPGRPVHPEAFAVHGISDSFLSDKPFFPAAVDALIEFIDDAPLIAHNASFDWGFLNGELGLCARDPLCTTRMICTLAIARTRHPGAKHSLDALCSRYGVDRSHRVLHGALLDAQLLAQVYVELMGGRQIGLGLVAETTFVAPVSTATIPSIHRAPRVFSATQAELAAHRAFMGRMKNPVWGIIEATAASG